MTEPTRASPGRGEVYLAVVPFAAKLDELRQLSLDAAGAESDTSFYAEIQLKLRPVLVVQADTITHQSGYDYVVIAPIYTVQEKHRARKDYATLVAQRLPQVFFLDRREQGVTRPSYVALAQIQLLHRSVFRERRGLLSTEDMRLIDDRLRFCLGL